MTLYGAANVRLYPLAVVGSETDGRTVGWNCQSWGMGGNHPIVYPNGNLPLRRKPHTPGSERSSGMHHHDGHIVVDPEMDDSQVECPACLQGLAWDGITQHVAGCPDGSDD